MEKPWDAKVRHGSFSSFSCVLTGGRVESLRQMARQAQSRKFLHEQELFKFAALAYEKTYPLPMSHLNCELRCIHANL